MLDRNLKPFTIGGNGEKILSPLTQDYWFESMDTFE